MSLQVFREFHGAFELVGSFSQTDGADTVFAYDERYLAQKTVAPLSTSLPLQHEAYDADRYGAFFSGMIPEGPVRAELSARFQIPQSDYLSMLARLGEECVGALMFRSEGQGPSTPGLKPLRETEIAELQKSEVIEIENGFVFAPRRRCEDGWRRTMDDSDGDRSLDAYHQGRVERAPRSSDQRTDMYGCCKGGRAGYGRFGCIEAV